MKKIFLFIGIMLLLSSSIVGADDHANRKSVCEGPNYAQMSHENCLKALDNLKDGIKSYLRVDHNQSTEKNYAKALKLFRPLVDQGNADAQYHLAQMYIGGLGASRDYPKAIKLYLLSAAQGHELAQHRLGLLYKEQEGEGVRKDYKKAVKFFHLAAGQGNADAQYQLGWMYYEGEGVKKDYVRANMWFNFAARNGRLDAEERLNELIDEMKSSQIEKAKKMTRDCEMKNYKGCE